MNPFDGSLQKKTSFYYPFLLLPRRKREALEVLYRFCWMADEAVDFPGSSLSKKRKALQELKENLAACLTAGLKGRKVGRIFQDLQQIIQEFKLSPGYLWTILKGVETDLKPVCFRTFSQLLHYARQVAGGPGLASMEIFGFKDGPHRRYAANLGVFLQIVNIVRDFKEDMDLGRQYLPSEDFKKFHLVPADIQETHSGWKSFVEFELSRAWSFLEKARGSLTRLERAELPTAEAIAAIYVKLHHKLKADPHRILKGRVSLALPDKLFSALGTASRCLLWKWMGDY